MATDTTVATYLCTGCPLGCRLEVEEEEGAIVEVRGFACKLGKEYAIQEHTDPRRMVTTTIRIMNSLWPKLPVRTSTTVPKDRVQAVCQVLRSLRVKAPIKRGEVIVPNILGSGADIIATRDMPVAGSQ